MADPGHQGPKAYHLSAATYVERDGKILLLKRAEAKVTACGGSQVAPLSATNGRRTPLDGSCSRRQVWFSSEQLRVIGVFPQHVYGRDSYCVTYACAFDEGDVEVSHEHTAHRWMDPSEHRERYFAEALLSSINDAHLQQLVTDIRDDLDRYLQWKMQPPHGLLPLNNT